jgi:hypothetical protein
MQNLGMLSLDQEMCFAVEMSNVSTVEIGEPRTSNWSEVLQFATL